MLNFISRQQVITTHVATKLSFNKCITTLAVHIQTPYISKVQMDHSGMDHGGHGDMDMGPRCSMNACTTLFPAHAPASRLPEIPANQVRCCSPGPLRTYVSSSASGISPAPSRSLSRYLPSSYSPPATRPSVKSAEDMNKATRHA